ncbi:MAG: HIT family protein [Defluviitaleaceae bacterium]|nr:HIT family protein [Defluviitaleaceae bacterium]
MDNCIFCKIARGEINSWKVYEDEHTFAFLDISPATEYHTLVIPKAHYVNVLDIPAEVFAKVMQTVKKVVNLYQEKLGLENLQIIHNAGQEGQQDVFHLHIHIVPRYKNDGQSVTLTRQPNWQDKFSDMMKKLN